MSPIICPYCRSSVTMTQDGNCPVCRATIGDLAGNHTKAVDSLFSDDTSASGYLPQTSEVALPQHRLPLSIDEKKSRKLTARIDSPKFLSDHNHVAAPTRSTRSVILRYGILWVLFSFRGRIPRRVFWCVEILRLLAVQPAAVVLVEVFGDDFQTSQIALASLVALSFLILLAVHVKRWHDRGKSGWWLFIAILPVIGPIWAIVELGFLRGTVGWNDYGPDLT